MKLYAISDLHLERPVNREALNHLPSFPDDGLILAGDICSTTSQLQDALELLTQKFKTIVWVPGNHELWMTSTDHNSPSHLLDNSQDKSLDKSSGCLLSKNDSDKPNSSFEKYNAFVSICRKFDVHTPEDEYPLWGSKNNTRMIVPMHLLYDYSFRPVDIHEDKAIDWAKESGVLCRDEALINAHPHKSIKDWCLDRIDYTRKRLEECDSSIPKILVNHFPLRYDLVRTMRIPRFSIWCGTKLTEHWHKQYNADVVVSGHLHMRSTDYRDGVRFEEVSLGYPKDWRSKEGRGITPYLREIFPGPSKPYHHAGPFWKFRI